MASRVRAIAVVFVLAMLPLTGIFGAAVVALVVLRHGLVEGLTVALAAGVGIFAADWMLGLGVARAAATVSINWVPVIALAAVLARTGSQARALQLAAVLGCGAVAGVFAAAGDPAPVWEQVIREQLVPLLRAAGVGVEEATLDASLPAMAAMMTGMAAAFWALGHYVTVAIARWAQALLVNPGGFRREFHALRLGPIMTMASGVLFIAAMLTDNALATNLALVPVMIFATQGLAVLHGTVARARMHWGWLVPPYVFMTLLPPHMLALLAVMGFVDHWVDFRARVGVDDEGAGPRAG